MDEDMPSRIQQFLRDNAHVLGASALTLAGAAAASAYFSSKPEPLTPPLDLNNQSIVVNEKEDIRASGYLSANANLMTYLYDDAKTTYEAFLRGLRVSSEAFQDKVWAVADLGCQMFSMVPVPLYDTLGLAACKYIINQTELCTLVCDDVSKTIKLLKEASEMKSLKRIVLIRDSVPDDLKQVAAQHNLEVLTYNEVEEIGKKNAEEPKGVFSLEPSDTHLSYLPLAHMFERGMHIMLYMHGAQIGYFSGDIRKLTEDLMELRPSLFPTVPRLLNRIYDKVQAGVRGSWLKSLLLKWALAGKLMEVKQGIIRNNSIWDRLVFGRIQKMLGGRVRYIVTGSAPLSASVLDFTRCAFGCLVMEGYGQTESSAGITFNVPGETEAVQGIWGVMRMMWVQMWVQMWM
nr:hypothetical protein BaRGS_002799 [Batillaria attramentaria]